MTEQHEFNPNEWQDSGAKWADGFRKIILDQGIPVDEDLMLGWFCNAIEIAHTHRLQTDTRPSASREEIAMAIGFASRHKFDVSKDAAEFWEHLSSDGRRWYLRMADAVLGIQPTPTPGNTDPMLIAKYDDELRKVQGRVQPDWEGFGRAITEDWPTSDIDGSDLFDMSLKYGLIAEIPGGYNPDEHIDSEGICPERGDPWYEYTFRSAPTEHPTEQPSVRDAARVDVEDVVKLAHSMTGDWDHIEVHLFEAALRSLAQEGE